MTTPISSAPFSLLMSVYDGDDPAELALAFASVTTQQTLPPDQVVLVRDGPVRPALQTQIDDLITVSTVPVTYVPLEANQRLAKALTVGLARCDHEIVARADADDICVPERFAAQIPLMAELDLLGTAVAELSDDGGIGVVRSRPEGPAEIRAYAAMHNPFNHPTVVFRRSVVQAAGGYLDLPFMEDYWLFLRMIAGGARCANLPEVLVHYRVGSDLYDRRGGATARASEWEFQRRARALGFTTRAQMVRNLMIRQGYRLVPGWVRRWGYQHFATGSGSAGPGTHT